MTNGALMTCGFCAAPNPLSIAFWASDWEYGVPGRWAIARCDRCGMYFQSPPPAPDLIPSFYPPTYSAYAEDPTTGWMFRMTYWLDARRIRRLIGRRGRVLDVGCGNGAALAAMREHGDWEVHGVELDEVAAEKARRRGLTVITGDLTSSALPLGTFDLIRMGHVIEHVPNPLEMLRRSVDLLRPGGVVYGETPNTHCWDFKLFRQYWGALHVPRHIAFFDEKNLRQALSRAGFTDILMKPRLRTVGWSAGIQNWLADKHAARVPASGRVSWYPLLIVCCLPLTVLQSLVAWPATVAFSGRKPPAAQRVC